MKKLLLLLLLTTFLSACAAANGVIEKDIPKPGDPDFIGPLSEEELKELEDK